jgi:thioredoxin reductase (NADPH)
MAIGRTANTKDLNLGKVGVKVNPHNYKVISFPFFDFQVIGGFGEAEKTSVDNIYAIGDVLDKVPELTPVASKSGQFLAKRLAM